MSGGLKLLQCFWEIMTTKNSKVVGSLEKKNMLQRDLSYENEEI